MDDHRFVAAGLNTLYFAFGTVPTGVLTSLLLAVLINLHTLWVAWLWQRGGFSVTFSSNP